MRTAEVDFYKVLGVGSSATAVEIKQKYRELSKKYHPDTNGGDAKRMMLINEAYGVLSNPLKRREYQPPSGAPKATPRQNSTNSYYGAQTPPGRRTNVKRQTRPVMQQETVSAWKALFFYVMAIPVAILIVTFALPFIQSMLPKINPIPTSVPLEPTRSDNAPATSPVEQTAPTNAVEQTPAPTIETPLPTQSVPTPTTDTTGNSQDTDETTSPLYYQFRRNGN